jgi:sulfite exporter TauE/SafE
VVLAFLTLAAAALGAALIAALGGMRRTTRVSLGMLLIAYALLLVAAWFRFMTDPNMFQDTEPDASVVLRYEKI